MSTSLSEHMGSTQPARDSHENSSPQGDPERDMRVGISGKVLADDVLTQCQGSS